jgi:hypothetical protein
MNRLSVPVYACRVAAINLLATVVVSACGPALDDDPQSPIDVAVEQTYVTIGNRSGSPLVDGIVELVPSGVLAPYRYPLTRIESGSNRQVPLDRFSGAGGARFMRGAARIRSVRLTATDVAGKKYKREVPFK